MNYRFHTANATLGIRHMFIRDLVLEAEIGVHADEHGRKQRVRINLDLAVNEGRSRSALTDRCLQNDLSSVVDYGPIVQSVCTEVEAGHVDLVETLAERLAAICLVDRRVSTVWVRVEKLDVYSSARSVGVEIQRQQSILHQDEASDQL